MIHSINNKLIAYTNNSEAHLIDLGFQPLSDRDRLYMETFPMMVIESGHLIAPSHWHYDFDEIFFIDGALIFEGEDYRRMVNDKIDEWNTNVIEAFKDEDVSDDELSFFLQKPKE